MTKKNMYKKSDRTFVNPYNFVSIDRKKIKQENIEETYKDKEELHTGYLDCVLVAKTPLAIPDLPEGEESGGESKHDFFSINGNDQKNPMIPGSSLRGMIRSVYETITESCLSTMKPDTHLFSRAGAEQHYKPGILKEKDGEWKLYKVKEIDAPPAATTAAAIVPSATGQSTILILRSSIDSKTISVVITALPKSIKIATPSSLYTSSTASVIFSKLVPNPPSSIPPAAFIGVSGAIKDANSTTPSANFWLWDTTDRLLYCKA